MKKRVKKTLIIAILILLLASFIQAITLPPPPLSPDISENSQGNALNYSRNSTPNNSISSVEDSQNSIEDVNKITFLSLAVPFLIGLIIILIIYFIYRFLKRNLD
jgi:hypothetical protein